MATNYDFIPANKPAEDKFSAEERLNLICKAFLNSHKWYDGRNVYAPKEAVVKTKDGNYTFKDGRHIEKDDESLFYPDSAEIRNALAIFKQKGYVPYYDNDICEYGYVESRESIRGEWRLRHTIFL